MRSRPRRTRRLRARVLGAAGATLQTWMLLCAMPAGAQTSTPASPPTPPAAATPAAAAVPEAAASQPEAAAPECTAQAPCLRADSQEAVEKGHFRARGFVDFQAGDVRIQADQCDLFETQDPDGMPRRRVEASGNVVFLRGEERLSGESMRMDMTTGQGTFERAFGYVTPGVFIEGSRITRLSSDTYRIADGRFTSCAQTSPRWSFGASSAKLVVDKRVTGHNVIFRVKDVPVFYLPYFIYPLHQDQRSTGLLMPTVGYSQLRGYKFGDGFFWAMGRSADQTFYFDHYTRFGDGFGHDLRYLLDSPSRGNFRTYAFHPKDADIWDYDLDWSAAQRLPGGVQANLLVRQYSNLLFQQRFQDTLDLASQRTRRSSLNLQRSVHGFNFSLLADTQETFFADGSRINRHLPTLRLFRTPRKLGRSGFVFGFESRAERLAQGDQDGVTQYSRVDIFPRLSRPLALSFLQLNPEVRLRYTSFGATLGEDGLPVTGQSVERRYFESTLEARGPTFARVLSTPGNFYSEKFKHTIGPEVTWTYRTRVEDFTQIPKFDGNDYALGTNQLSYGLMQRFYAKRRAKNAKKAEAYEFLNWRVGQTYYVNISEGQNAFDPNYSTNVFGPGGVPAHTSPLQSRIRFRPTPLISTNFDVEYDVNFRQLRSLGVSGSLAATSRFRLDGGWSRSLKTSRQVDRRTPISDTLRGVARFDLVPGHLSVEGTADYDLIRKLMVHQSARLRYSVQCCGLLAEMVESNFNTSQRDRQFRFSIELANIGAIGNFTGQDTLSSGGGARRR